MIGSAVWYLIERNLFVNIGGRMNVTYNLQEKFADIPMDKKLLLREFTLGDEVIKSDKIELKNHRMYITKKKKTISVTTSHRYETKLSNQVIENYEGSKSNLSDPYDLTIPYRIVFGNTPGFSEYFRSARNICHIFPLGDQTSVVILGSAKYLEFITIENKFKESKLNIRKVMAITDSSAVSKEFRYYHEIADSNYKMQMISEDNTIRINAMVSDHGKELANKIKALYRNFIQKQESKRFIVSIPLNMCSEIKSQLGNKTARITFGKNGIITVIHYDKAEPTIIETDLRPEEEVTLKSANMFGYTSSARSSKKTAKESKAKTESEPDKKIPTIDVYASKTNKTNIMIYKIDNRTIFEPN